MTGIQENVYKMHKGEINKEANGLDLIYDICKKTSDDGKITYEFEIEDSDNAYIYLLTESDEPIKIYLNDEQLKNHESTTEYEMIDLGKKQIGEKIKLEILPDGDLLVDNIYVAYENEEILQKHYQNLSKKQAYIQKINGRKYKGTVSISEDDEYVLFTIPYEEGWKITVDGNEAIKEKALQSKTVVIVGGGYIGLELLEAFIRQNLHVILFEHGPYLMKRFDEDISTLVYEQLISASNGRYEIYTSEAVIEFSGDIHGIKSVKTSTGREISTDFVVIASGVKANSEIAKDAGIKVGDTGAISVNNRMQTNFEDIYACGDCCEDNFIISNTPGWFPLGSTANKEGRVAAINACGGDEIFKGVLGSAVTRCLSLTVSMTGLTVKDAEKLGYKPVSVTVTKNDKVGFMPDVNNITLKLIADKTTGLLLGCQAVGTGDADKRVNTVTSALLAGLTVREFYNNDITYAPPYSPTIDPLLNAAQMLASKVEY